MLQPTPFLTLASATVPGYVSTVAQTFAGDKTFNGKIVVTDEIDFAGTHGLISWGPGSGGNHWQIDATSATGQLNFGNKDATNPLAVYFGLRYSDGFAVSQYGFEVNPGSGATFSVTAAGLLTANNGWVSSQGKYVPTSASAGAFKTSAGDILWQYDRAVDNSVHFPQTDGVFMTNVVLSGQLVTSATGIVGPAGLAGAVALPNGADINAGKALYLNGATQTIGLFDNAGHVDFFGGSKYLFDAGIGVGNAASASVIPVSGLVKKIEIFDTSGTSLGFIPVYSSIT